MEAEHLHHQQLQLSHILETAASPEATQRLLQFSALANTDWKIEKWEPYMLETAMHSTQQWKK